MSSCNHPMTLEWLEYDRDEALAHPLGATGSFSFTPTQNSSRTTTVKGTGTLTTVATGATDYPRP